ncbi:hypothetical protein CAEBREN_06156 [Caenorhabditis brenneri]|uniref:Domain of unknown function DX domain-containing protein n=1 Tax=Caenorhabditis brenneri TaxID=135651 RepID=G0MS20_CAEBE|nr:hypothetical protein CAEBREN_06156 [Caenorhabditis brenneri]
MQHFSASLLVFFIVCCYGVRSNSLTTTDSTSDPSDDVSGVPTSDSTSTVSVDFEQTKTTTVHESNDLRTSAILSSTMKIAASSHVTCVISENTDDSGCCYKRTAGMCSEGIAALPIKKCETLDDCNLQKERTAHRWCDPVTKTCCRLDEEQELLCPDNVTPLKDEPHCLGYKKEDIWSGKCPTNMNGTCKYGHCCPRNNSNSSQPAYSHKTNRRCTNNTVIPKNQVYGYCDPESGKVFIMGQLNDKNQSNVALPFYCRSNRDCGKSFSMNKVCVRMDANYLRCYHNPQIQLPSPQKRSLFLLSSLSYTALGTSLLALLFALLYKYYRIDYSQSAERSTSSELSQPLMTSQE